MSESFLNKDSILAGGHVPHIISDRLSLVALVEEESRATIIKKLITDYLKDQPADDKLIHLLAERIVDIWSREKESFGGSFKNYLEQDVTSGLKRRRISKQHITEIIAKAGELNEADEKPRRTK